MDKKTYWQNERHPFSAEIRKKILAYSRRKDNWHGPLAVIEDFFWITIAIMLSEYSLWFLPITVIIIGARQRALANLLHEAVHYTLCKSRKLNYILGTFFSGFWIGQTFYRYKDSHIRFHHKYLGESDTDPDLIYYNNMGVFSIRTGKQFILRQLIPSLLFLNAPKSIWHIINDRLIFKDFSKAKKEHKIEYILFICFWFIILSVVTILGIWSQFLLYWALPFLTTFQAIGWLIELSEHYPIIRLHTKDLYMSRNRFGNWLEIFLMGTHGENYHLLHHLFPGIPFYHYRSAHKALMEDFEYAEYNNRSGGIITPSKEGRKNIIKEMLEVINNNNIEVVN